MNNILFIIITSHRRAAFSDDLPALCQTLCEAGGIGHSPRPFSARNAETRMSNQFLN
ncbi:hypothetical protein HMPREF3156_02662 [Neisseria sp. HMSC06F02]|nr:hypothetical protein HMPREF3156_02662 [Neisseria sp. HMSC06F02]